MLDPKVLSDNNRPVTMAEKANLIPVFEWFINQILGIHRIHILSKSPVN